VVQSAPAAAFDNLASTRPPTVRARAKTPGVSYALHTTAESAALLSFKWVEIKKVIIDTNNINNIRKITIFILNKKAVLSQR